ncbi:hypothetical protein WMY93_006440 [Mugilogobius chulae]|uniref:Immunoglobulin V-set domain-containing protein n=1 Tax=Mugilogobius chulae TaxID=88201 RepID=A0AAW0PJU8_9GOBI
MWLYQTLRLMEGRVCLLFVICGVSAVGLRVSGSIVDVMLKPGDNTTLHCDCKCPVGVYTVWYRNCSHSNQPTLVLSTKNKGVYKPSTFMNLLPGYQFVKISSLTATTCESLISQKMMVAHIIVGLRPLQFWMKKKLRALKGPGQSCGLGCWWCRVFFSVLTSASFCSITSATKKMLAQYKEIKEQPIR